MDRGGGGLGVVAVPAGVQGSVHGVEENFPLNRVAPRGRFTSSDLGADDEVNLDARRGIKRSVGGTAQDIRRSRDVGLAPMRSVHGLIANELRVDAGDGAGKVREQCCKLTGEA